MNHIEQIEMIIIGGRVYTYFRNKSEAISNCFGRSYSHLTDASLQRVVNVMNSGLCIVKVKKDGRFMSVIATRADQTPKGYTWQEHEEMSELPDPWG